MNNNDLEFILVFIGCAALAIIVFVVVNLLMNSKGNIKLSLSQDWFAKGRRIEGLIHIHAKKRIASRELVLTLVAMNNYVANGEHYGKVVYERKFRVAGPCDFSPGAKKKIKFAIQSPTVGELAKLHEKCYQPLIGKRQEKIVWIMKVRLASEGLDVRIEEPISAETTATEELHRATSG